MNHQQTPDNASFPQPKSPLVAPGKTAPLPTKKEEQRQENEGGPPVKHAKTAAGHMRPGSNTP